MLSIGKTLGEQASPRELADSISHMVEVGGVGWPSIGYLRVERTGARIGSDCVLSLFVAPVDVATAQRLLDHYDGHADLECRLLVSQHYSGLWYPLCSAHGRMVLAIEHNLALIQEDAP